MRVATVRGDVSLRARSFGTAGTSFPTPTDNALTTNTPSSSVSVPAVMASIRLISDSISAMPCKVYRKNADGTPEPDYAATQYDLLHRAPNASQSPFEFWQDVTCSIETFGNAYILKTQSRGEVRELRVIRGDRVRVLNEDSYEPTYEIRDGDDVAELTSKELLHIRGIAPFGGAVGLSPLEAHRQVLANAQQVNRFQGAFFQNDAAPGAVIRLPQQVNAEQAKEIADLWNSAHAGAGRARRTAVLGGGAELTVMPVNMQDLAMVDQMKMSVHDVARVFGLPAQLITGDPIGDTQQVTEQFLKFCLAPRMRRIESALRADQQLFPPQDELYPEFKADSLLRPSTRERYEAMLKARQAGWLTANEIRALENYPAVEGGDDLQMTPVGGAPNLTQSNDPTE